MSTTPRPLKGPINVHSGPGRGGSQTAPRCTPHWCWTWRPPWPRTSPDAPCSARSAPSAHTSLVVYPGGPVRQQLVTTQEYKFKAVVVVTALLRSAASSERPHNVMLQLVHRHIPPGLLPPLPLLLLVSPVIKRLSSCYIVRRTWSGRSTIFEPQRVEKCFFKFEL